MPGFIASMAMVKWVLELESITTGIPSTAPDTTWFMRLPISVMVEGELASNTRLSTPRSNGPEKATVDPSTSSLEVAVGISSQTAKRVLSDGPIVKSDRSAAKEAAPPSVEDQPARLKPVLES